MARSRTTVLICLLLATVLQVCVQQTISNGQIIARANRVLQSTAGKIEITESPNVKKYCDESGVKKDEITISIEARNKKREDTPLRYPGLVAAFDAALSSNSANEVANKVAGTGAGFSLVIAILSFLSVMFLFLWSIFECCCEKTCCVDKQKKQEGRGWVRWCCFIGAIAIGITSVVITIAWAALVGKFTSNAKEVKCSFTILHNDLINGAQITADSKFIGLNGIDSLFAQFITLLDSIDGPTGIKSNAQNIKNRNIGQATTDMNAQYSTFKTSFSQNSYTYTGSIDNSVTVISGFAVIVKGAIDSDALKKEADKLNEVGKAVDDAATTISNYNTAGIQQSKTDLQNTRNTMRDSLKKPLDNAYNTLVESKTDYVAQVKKAGTGLMAAAIVIIIVFTIVYFLILFMNIRDRWHKAKCITKIIMLLQLLMAVLISIMSVIGVIVSISFAWICNGISGMISTENFLKTNFKGLSVDKKFLDITSTCIYKGGDGDLFKALGMNLKTITEVNSITGGLTTFSQFKSNLTQQNAPFVGGNISTQIDQGIGYTIDIRGVPESQDTTAGISSFNGFGCSSDIMKLNNCPSDYTASTTNDTRNQSLGSKYCIVGNGIPLHSYADRYTTAPTCTGGTAANAQNVLTRTSDAIKAQKLKVTTLKTDYESGFYAAEFSVFTKLKASINDLDIISSKLTDTLSSMNSLGNTLPKLVDCRVMQKEVIMFENVVCFRIAEDYYQQTSVGVALGFILFINSWFMCCTIRLTNKKDEKPDAGQNYNDPQPAYQNQGDKAYDHYQ